MIIRTTKHGLAIICIAMGVLCLIIPKGWDDAPLAKIIVAGFFIGMGYLGGTVSATHVPNGVQHMGTSVVGDRARSVS